MDARQILDPRQWFATGVKVVDAVRGPVLTDLTGPVRIPLAWYLRAWVRRFSPPAQPGAGSLPPSLRLAAQAALDETVLTVARRMRRMPDDEDLARVEDEAAVAITMFRSQGWLDDPASYHTTPPLLTTVDERPARSFGIRYTVASFDSDYEPGVGEPGRERWLADVENRTAYAWVLRHEGEPRPWVVCVHGAAMGQATADLRVFRAAWLHQALGLNVALPIQPRHGPRKAGVPVSVGFPSQDLMDNVHAVAQSVWDIRRLIGWIRSTHGAADVAVHGLSLGGYTTALLAGIEPDLRCVILGVPAVDFGALIARHAGPHFRDDPRLGRFVTLAEDVHRVISPLAVEPLVPQDRRFIYAGLADRLIHPVHQIREIERHWGDPEIHWFAGSHVGFFLSRPVRDYLEQSLQTAEMLPATDPTGAADS
jgi:hypothetical protein